MIFEMCNWFQMGLKSKPNCTGHWCSTNIYINIYSIYTYYKYYVLYHCLDVFYFMILICVIEKRFKISNQLYNILSYFDVVS